MKNYFTVPGRHSRREVLVRRGESGQDYRWVVCVDGVCGEAQNGSLERLAEQYAALGAAWCSHTGGSCINMSGHTQSTHTEFEGSFCCKGPRGMTSLDKDLGKCTEEGTNICSIVVGDPNCTVPNCA